MTRLIVFGSGLPRELVDHRLGVERVEVARAAVHEQEDHALGGCCKLPGPGGLRRRRGFVARENRVRGEKTVVGQQAVQGQRAEAAPCAAKKIAPRGSAFVMSCQQRLLRIAVHGMFLVNLLFPSSRLGTHVLEALFPACRTHWRTKKPASGTQHNRVLKQSLGTSTKLSLYFRLTWLPLL